MQQQLKQTDYQPTKSLLDVLIEDGFHVEQKTKDEYCSQCPICGGTDRFYFKPGYASGKAGEYRGGTYGCRQCKRKGNLFTYLTDIKGMTFPEACEYAGCGNNNGSGYSPEKIHAGIKKAKLTKKVKGRRPFSDYKIIYEYKKTNGEVDYYKSKAVANEKYPKKSMMFYYIGEDGRKVFKQKPGGVNIFNADKIFNAAKDVTLYYCEGEPDALELEKRGLLTTTHRFGAENAQWTKEDFEIIGDRDTVFVFDCDVPGVEYALRFTRQFLENGYDENKLKMVYVKYEITGIHGKDVSNFIEENNFDAFMALERMSVAEFRSRFGEYEKLDEPEPEPEQEFEPEPEPKSDVAQKIIDDIKEKAKDDETIFWYYNFKNECKIDRVKFVEYLNMLGYCKVIVNDCIYFVKQEKNVFINDTDIKMYRSRIKDEIEPNIKTKKDYKVAKASLMLSSNTLFSDQNFEYLKTVEFKDVPKIKDVCHLFYENFVLEITKDGEKEIKYSDFKYHVWEKQIIKRKYKKENWTNFEFALFCLNVSGISDKIANDTTFNDDTRLRSLASGLGYMMHRYNDASNMKCVILVDEKAQNALDRKGGTGKGITETALSHMRNLVQIKDKKINNTFGFQQINFDTDIVNIPDIEPKFNFNDLYTYITDGMQIERKNKQEFTINKEDMPKFLVSSNHVVRGIEPSDIRRKFEIYFSDYYNENFTPADEFGHNFFSDWNESDWNKFDSFMVHCIQVYLRNGLIYASNEEIENNKLIAETDENFINFMDIAIDTGIKTTTCEPDLISGGTINKKIELKIELNEAIKKDELFTLFKKFYHEVDYSRISPHRFTKWINAYAKFRDLNVFAGNSSGKQTIKFFK